MPNRASDGQSDERVLRLVGAVEAEVGDGGDGSVVGEVGWLVVSPSEGGKVAGNEIESDMGRRSGFMGSVCVCVRLVVDEAVRARVDVQCRTCDGE